MSATKTINEQIAEALKSASPTANALVLEGYVVLAPLGAYDDSHPELRTTWWRKFRKLSGWQRDPEMVATATFDIERLKRDIQSGELERKRNVGRAPVLKIADILGFQRVEKPAKVKPPLPANARIGESLLWMLQREFTVEVVPFTRTGERAVHLGSLVGFSIKVPGTTFLAQTEGTAEALADGLELAVADMKAGLAPLPA